MPAIKKSQGLLAAAILAAMVAAHADLDITVTGGETAAQPIAVVPFAQAPGAPADVAAIVAADLDRSGLFRTLKREDMKFELPTQQSQVDYRTWRALGQEALVIGNVAAQPSGAAQTHAELYDVFRTQKTLNIDSTATRATEWRSMAHKVADQIYQKLTGVKGIFDTRIAYVTVATDPQTRKPKYKLIWADADGENPRVIASTDEPMLSPAWSPDGRRIAYVVFDHGRSKIIIQTPTTGEFVTFSAEKGINSAPAWTPDGNKLVVTLSFEQNADLYLIDVATRSRRRLTDSYAIDTEAAVSPDGRTVAFLSDRGGSAQIYLMSIDGGEPKRISFDGKRNEQPRFSPDGKSLALVNFDGSSYRIGLMDVQSGALRLISDGPLDETPSFAPNGALVIYTRQGPKGSELATISTDGRIRQQLRQTGDVRESAWAPFARP